MSIFIGGVQSGVMSIGWKKIHTRGVEMDRDYVKQPLQVLSFGAGTQSTAMLILSAEGHLKKPELVIFADTGSETAETYAHVEEWAKPFCKENEIPFEVVQSSKGALHEFYLK